MKKFALFMSVITTLFTFSIGKPTYAKYWQMTLNPFTMWSQESQNWDTKDFGGNSGYISLTKIDDIDSYYFVGRAVNSNGEIRSTRALCHQGGPNVGVTEQDMENGYKYWLDGYNENFKTSYVWAYGNFGWY
ncbi:MAG: hypothetical protein ABRQ27_08020 [Clostridiaceae bacterium]